jgi:mono/diheme cytochrome c family protein
VDRGVLRNSSPELLANPPRIKAATPEERAALGYLHGNCGHCHNDEGPLAVLEMTLAQRVGSQERQPRRAAFRRRCAEPVSRRRGGARVAPGHPASSVVALRMRSREPTQQMPPLGSTVVDTEAMALIARWIESLPNQ